jgi:hypothetical protein
MKNILKLLLVFSIIVGGGAFYGYYMDNPLFTFFWLMIPTGLYFLGLPLYCSYREVGVKGTLFLILFFLACLGAVISFMWEVSLPVCC